MSRRISTWKILLSLISLGAVVVVGIVQVTQAKGSRKTELLQYDSSGALLTKRTLVFPEGFQGGASIAVGDMDNDGDDDFVMGAGPGGGPQVIVMDGEGRILANFLAYAPSMREGVNVAVGDLNGDGNLEIGTVPAYGPSHVRIFDRVGVPRFVPFGFDAFNGLVRHGATIALADRDDDGKDEIYVGSGVRTAGHVRGFDQTGNYIGVDYFPWHSANAGGVQVTRANVDGGADELVMGILTQNGPHVKVYRLNAERTILADFKAFPEELVSGVRVSAADVDGDGQDEVLVSAGPGAGNHVKIFEGNGQQRATQLFPAYEADFRGGTWPAAGDFNGDGTIEYAVVPTKQISNIAAARQIMTQRGGMQVAGDLPEYGKAIEVDLSEQRLYAFDDGKQVNTFLISSGIAAFPTPTGSFAVDQKKPVTNYLWTYGPDDPANYNIPDVPFNLRFSWPYYLHAAYWHNNFGRPMSHGCVNIDEPDAEWLYNWAPVGTPVLIHD